jgi:hypothetical protein
MAEQFHTSFIPKKNLDGPRRDNVTGSGFALFVGILATIVSVALVGGVYAYEAYLQSAIGRKEEQLRQQRDAFAPEVIRDMSRLSTKLSVADRLLRDHVAVSEIFNLLQQVTLKTIQFNTFNFGSGQDGVHVTLQGQGLSFSSVALQADEFARNPNFSDTMFSNFALDSRGNVTFSVSTLVNPRLISYREVAGQRSSIVVEPLENLEPIQVEPITEEVSEGVVQESEVPIDAGYDQTFEGI